MCVTLDDAPQSDERVFARPRRVGDVPRADLVPVDEVQITILIDNAVDYLLADVGPAKRVSSGRLPPVEAPQFEGGTTFNPLIAEHGFSALVTTRRLDTTHRLLYDTGLSPDGMAHNIRALGIDPTAIEALVISHGHYDHTGGLAGFARLRSCDGLMLLLHPLAWTRRRVARAGRPLWELPALSKQWLESEGFALVERRDSSLLFEDTILITGEVARTTEFETGMRAHEALSKGEWIPDPWILDDQALVVNVRGKGLVVLTGCGHAGVVNIGRYAQRLTGEDRVHALIGGFHLQGPGFDEVVNPTVDALARLAPDTLVPSHCTGRRARHHLAAMLPEAFITNSVGSVYTFTAV